MQSNVRAGPGTGFAIVGSQGEGDTILPVGRTSDGQWLELGSGRWIYAPLVDGELGGLPISQDIPQTQLVESAPTPTPAVEGDTGPLPIAAALGVPNSPPVFVTYVDGNPKEVTELSNYENISESSVSAMDENEEDTEFGFEITGGDDASLFTLYRVAQSKSVIVTFVTKPDFEAPHDKNADNTYEIQLTVTSGTGDRTLSTTTNFKYRVLDREELPGIPVFLEGRTDSSDSTITVHWRHGSDTGAPPADYLLRYREEDSDGDYRSGPDLNGSDTEATIEGLEPGTEYRIELKAVGDDGETQFRDARTRASTSGRALVGPAQPSYNRDARERLFDAIREEDADTVRSMISERGFPIFLYEIRFENITALHFAVRSSLETLEVLLAHPDAEPDLRCDIGIELWERDITALHRAVLEDRFNMITTLLKHGADPNARTVGGLTPLHLVSKARSPDETFMVIPALLKHGADPNSLNDAGLTPMLYTIIERASQRWTLSLVVLLHLLDDPDTDPNISDGDGKTALFHAVGIGIVNLVEAILNHPATDPNKTTGTAPIHAAIVLGQQDHAILKLLLGHRDIDPNVKDSDGRTPLHYAVLYGSPDTINLLLKQTGIDVSIQDNEGRTPLEYAEFLGGREEKVALLQQQEE